MTALTELIANDNEQKQLATVGWRDIVVRYVADESSVSTDEMQRVLEAAAATAKDLQNAVNTYRSRQDKRARIAAHKATGDAAMAEITRKQAEALQVLRAAEAVYQQSHYTLQAKRDEIAAESMAVQQLERDLVEGCEDKYLAARRAALPGEINRAENAAFADRRAGRESAATETLGRLRHEQTTNYTACFNW